MTVSAPSSHAARVRVLLLEKIDIYSTTYLTWGLNFDGSSIVFFCSNEIEPSNEKLQVADFTDSNIRKISTLNIIYRQWVTSIVHSDMISNLGYNWFFRLKAMVRPFEFVHIKNRPICINTCIYTFVGIINGLFLPR